MTLCQELLSKPRTFHIPSTFSGWTLCELSTALQTISSLPLWSFGISTVASHSVHAHDLYGLWSTTKESCTHLTKCVDISTCDRCIYVTCSPVSFQKLLYLIPKDSLINSRSLTIIKHVCRDLYPSPPPLDHDQSMLLGADWCAMGEQDHFIHGATVSQKTQNGCVKILTEDLTLFPLTENMSFYLHCSIVY